MSPTKFYLSYLKRSLHGGWAWAEIAAFVVALGGGAVDYFYSPLPSLTWLAWAVPFTVLVGTIIVGFFWSAYQLYAEESEARSRLQEELDKIKTDPRREEMLRELSGLVERAQTIIDRLGAADDEIALRGWGELAKWDRQTRCGPTTHRFVSKVFLPPPHHPLECRREPTAAAGLDVG